MRSRLSTRTRPCLPAVLLPVLLLALPLFAACSESHPDTPDELARSLVDMLRQDDRESFVSRLYLNEDHLDCLAEYGGRDMAGGVERNRAVLPYLRVKAAWEWTVARDQAMLAGVDWSRAEFDGVSYRLEQEQSFLFSDLLVRVRCGDELWELRLDDCIKCGDHWFTMDSLRFQGRSP